MKKKPMRVQTAAGLPFRRHVCKSCGSELVLAVAARYPHCMYCGEEILGKGRPISGKTITAGVGNVEIVKCLFCEALMRISGIDKKADEIAAMYYCVDCGSEDLSSEIEDNEIDGDKKKIFSTLQKAYLDIPYFKLLSEMKNADASEECRISLAQKASAVACPLIGWSEDAHELYNTMKLLGDSKEVRRQLIDVAADFVVNSLLSG